MARKKPSIIPLMLQLQFLAKLNGISAVLSWDQETYMPIKSIGLRSQQSAVMAKLIHERWISDEFHDILSHYVDLVSGVVNPVIQSPIHIRLIEETYREWRQANALPNTFVDRASQLTSEAQHVWQQARKRNDFAQFAPYLDKLMAIAKQKADFLGYDDQPYDALLDTFEPGATTAQLTPLFDELGRETRFVVDRLRVTQPPKQIIPGPFDQHKQWDVGMMMLRLMGFDFKRGRQDYSAHPFTTDFGLSDVRITTRMNDMNIMEGLSSTIHEGGHALYEQGLDPKWCETPVGAACSLGIHESQSRLWEKLVGMSQEFWHGFYPKMVRAFPDQLAEVSIDAFYRMINYVQPTPIRVASDEVTYNLHILIRFELEKEMINGTVSAMALRELWNQKYRDYLGIQLDTDRDGILQDVHWSAGLIGYFPTYSLGNIYSVQLFEAAKNALPDLDDQIHALQFKPLLNWLRNNIHRAGRMHSAADLIHNVTGHRLSVAPFKQYLHTKFL